MEWEIPYGWDSHENPLGKGITFGLIMGMGITSWEWRICKKGLFCIATCIERWTTNIIY